jgi:hypothetical protein
MIKGLGTLMNIATVLIGGSAGLLAGGRLKQSLNQAVLNVMGLATIIVGIQMALNTKNILIVIFSLVMGTVIGELVNIERFVERAGKALEKRFSKNKDGKFARAFVATSLLFCVGPMTILGSIQDGLTGDYSLLATKSMLDGFAAMMFAAAMGIGVLFSALTVLVVQGGLTLFSGNLSGVMTEAVIAEITGTGGVMVVSIGLGIVGIKKLKTANMLPALVIAPLIVLVLKQFNL